MTDETAQAPAVKKEEKKSTGPRSKKPTGTPKATPSIASSANSGGANAGGARPSSRTSNKKPTSSASPPNDSNDSNKKKDADAKKHDGKKAERGGGRNQSQGRGGGNHRRGQASQSAAGRGQGNTAAKDDKPSTSPVPVPGSDNSDALTSLQRVITDLKSISPPSQSSVMPNASSMPVPQLSSNLPPNAPVFQPGAASFPTPGAAAVASARHRKAASLGSHSHASGLPAYPPSLQQFSSQLGAMMEDNEDVRTPQQQQFEEGEIPEEIYGQQPFPRGQQQQQQPGFTAPRFAALAGQQQGEVTGPSGRPQLAPTFTFGARRRAASNVPLGPPINEEEDASFQFPQCSQQIDFQPESAQGHNQGGDIRGQLPDIMREQIALQSQIEALQQQQQQLLQQQLASNQIMGTFNTQVGPGGRFNAHRRIQSQQIPGSPMSTDFGAFNLPGMGFNAGLGGGVGLGVGRDDSQALPRGHGRRHSVNVLNKPGQNNVNAFSQFVQDGYEDGFAPPAALGGHSRQASRADSTWRINGGAGAVGAGLGDLAQAQAQLQSLQQFRAAAGGHHQKMASFSFPNMLPNVMAANMMGLNAGGYNLLQQQQQQFQLQLQQQNQPQRKSLFAPYLPQASLPPLLAAGKLVVGILRVNKRNRSDAYVATEVLDADIYICGSKDRNRALEGDIVAVELLDVDEVWGTKKEKEEKKRKKEENAAYDPKSAAGRKNDKKKDDVEVEGQGLMLFEDEEVTDEVKPQFAGHIVAVVERMPGQLFSGTLGLLRPSSAATKEKQEAERREREGDRGEDLRRQPAERPKIVWFKPTDKRVPLIAIPTEQAPPDFVQNAEAYNDKLFVACIKRHPISSLHPFGTLVEELGPIGDVEVETSALLKDCNFPTEDFTENVIKCLPPMPWIIPERELEGRLDLRGDRIFTIDPDTAKDLDDALSIKTNEDGTYDVGIHIADVSYFVKPNTALDRDARKRATSVYLVQRAVPMLPPALSEQLCSLRAGEDRLTFSIIFTMTDDARVLKKWFGKTIIKSAAQLAYKNVQNVIDGKTLGDSAVIPDHDSSEIEHDIKILQNLARQMRTRRFENGCLALNSTRLSFELGEDGMPIDCSPYDTTEANQLVEEFMLLSNMSVAQQVALHLPEQALLRRHEDPIERRLIAFAERATRLGYKIDISSAGELMKSFEKIDNPVHRGIIALLSHKVTHRAKYFCAGMLDIAKYHHYALNAPLYTHFTSPIRRYADIVVHRQLESILQGVGVEPKFSMDRDSVAKIAQQCNIKKDSAKLAQEQSAHLFLCLLIADLTQRYGPVVRQAKVVGVLDAAFDVLVPEFGIEKRVHVDQMPIDNHVYDEHSHTLQIYWSERDVISWLAENSDDEHLRKVKQTAEQHALKMEVTSRSVQDESALFEEDEDEDEVVIGRTEKPETKETSKQRLLSQAKLKPEFEGLRATTTGHRIQEIRELQSVPVIVTADLTKSPPVIKVYSVNPYASQKK
ncbi:SSD1 protein [Hysterangium stoloniferum]|nr:SSD1 protein [Hysterangium stoloniferum]